LRRRERTPCAVRLDDGHAHLVSVEIHGDSRPSGAVGVTCDDGVAVADVADVDLHHVLRVHNRHRRQRVVPAVGARLLGAGGRRGGGSDVLDHNDNVGFGGRLTLAESDGRDLEAMGNVGHAREGPRLVHLDRGVSGGGGVDVDDDRRFGGGRGETGDGEVADVHLVDRHRAAVDGAGRGDDELLTHNAVASVALVALACEGAGDVGARAVGAAVVAARTFVDVMASLTRARVPNEADARRRADVVVAVCVGVAVVLAVALVDIRAGEAITNVALVASASERPCCVCARGLGVAVVGTSKALVLVEAIGAVVANVPGVAGAFERAKRVDAGSIRVAVVRMNIALVDVIASSAAACEPGVAVASEGTFSVLASGLGVAVVGALVALLVVDAREAIAVVPTVALAIVRTSGVNARGVRVAVVAVARALILIGARQAITVITRVAAA